MLHLQGRTLCAPEAGEDKPRPYEVMYYYANL